MKKFFIYLLLLLTILSPTTYADVRSAAEPPAPRQVNPQKNYQDMQRLYQEIPDLNDKEAVKAYLEKRLKIVQRANISPEEAATPQSVSIIDTHNLDKKQESTLSAYEKIYKESMERAKDASVPLNAEDRLDGVFYELSNSQTAAEPFVPDFPYVTIKLSDTKEIMAPAEEHIAYLLTDIKIETNAMMRVSEEFVFVSNNEGFPNGFFRILPKYNYSRNGTQRRYDLTLQSVTVNGEKQPYKITEIGNYLYIEPEKPLDLPTGIYTYKFNYIIDRAVWFYDNFDELYWDITGRTLKNVVGSANAIVTLPTGSTFLAQNAIISTRQGTDSQRVTIADLASNALAFADTEALGVGEDMHIFVTLPKETLLAPDLVQRYLWFIQDYGMVIFALMTLLAILIAYKISLAQIRKNKDKTRATIKKTPSIFRLINTNVFDVRSVLAEFLELLNKKIVDLRQDEDTVILVKKTDDIQKLPKNMQKLIRIIFPGAETILPAKDISKLKLERAYKYIRRFVFKEYRLYSLKLNKFYILSSVLMMLCGIIAASATAINPSHTFWIITVCSLLITPYIYLITLKFKRKWLDLSIKIFSALSILYISGWLSIYTSYLYAALMIISIGLIFYYYRAFSRRSGLLRNKIKETEEYKSYLQKNPELAISARDFSSRIPYIYAFGLENKYKTVETFELISQFEKFLTPTIKRNK